MHFVKKCHYKSSVFVCFLDMIISHTLQCILSETQLKSRGKQLEICDLFLDTKKLKLHLTVRD